MANSGDTLEQFKDQAFYSSEPPKLRPETREVLERYSKIPPDEVESHVATIRHKAWEIHPYPCIGQWRFLDLSIGLHNLYPEILTRMKTGDQTYLDLGCAFAQDVRRLVVDGVDSSKCYGSDLHLDFLELGYELFRDKETLKSKFIAADIFDPGSPLRELEGKIDIIGASSFFHLFDWEQQKRVAHRAVKFLMPQKDSLIVGRQVGNKDHGEKARRRGNGTRYRHNLESWRKFWTEVGDEAGVRFDVDGVEKSIPVGNQFRDLADISLEFSVRRL